jgi:hypothetical protein
LPTLSQALGRRRRKTGLFNTTVKPVSQIPRDNGFRQRSSARLFTKQGNNNDAT